MKKKILIAVAVVLILIQFVRIDKTNPETVLENDFISVNAPPAEIATILKTSCYDCHSNQSVYPWYSNVAPISWFLKNHINEAREHLNFSEWALYGTKDQIHVLKACGKEIENGKMPMSSYLIMHSEAKLSETQQKVLVEYFKSF